MPAFICKKTMVKSNCNLKIDSMVIRQCTEAINNIILFKARLVVDGNNVEPLEILMGSLVEFKMLYDTTGSFQRNLTDKSTVAGFIEINC